MKKHLDIIGKITYEYILSNINAIFTKNNNNGITMEYLMILTVTFYENFL